MSGALAGSRCVAQARFSKASVAPSSRSALQGQRLCFAPPPSFRRCHAKINTVIRANVITDVGKYLGEAAAQIFSSTKSDVDWEGTITPFAGRISHHDDINRLRVLYNFVQTAKKQIQGCTNPEAVNFNPDATVDDGSCLLVYEGGVSTEYENLGDYMTTAVEKLMKSNFKGEESEPDWTNTTYNYKGDIVPQRDIQRLLAFEKTVKKALEKAEADAKKK